MNDKPKRTSDKQISQSKINVLLAVAKMAEGDFKESKIGNIMTRRRMGIEFAFLISRFMNNKKFSLVAHFRFKNENKWFIIEQGLAILLFSKNQSRQCFQRFNFI